MASGNGPLDFVDKAGDCVSGIVVGLEPELCHGEEVMVLDVSIDMFGNDFF